MVKGIRHLTATDFNIYERGIGTRQNPFYLQIGRGGLFGMFKDSQLMKTSKGTKLMRMKKKR